MRTKDPTAPQATEWRQNPSPRREPWVTCGTWIQPRTGRSDPPRRAATSSTLSPSPCPTPFLAAPPGLHVTRYAPPMAYAMGFRSAGPPGLRGHPLPMNREWGRGGGSVAAGVSPAVEGGVSPPGIPGSWSVSMAPAPTRLPKHRASVAAGISPRGSVGSSTPSTRRTP